MTQRNSTLDGYVALNSSATKGSEPEARESGSEEPRRSPALLELHVPEDSVVYLRGQRMTLTGRKRVYLSQPLTIGTTYAYAIEVEATENGHTVKGAASENVTSGQIVQIEARFEDGGRKLVLHRESDISSGVASKTRPSVQEPETKVAGKSR